MLDHELAIEPVRRQGQPVRDWVVARHFFMVMARIPAWRMSQATRCLPTRCPRCASACQMLGLP